MYAEVRCICSMASSQDAVQQMDDSFGANFVRLVEAELSLEQIDKLCIFVSIMPHYHLLPPDQGRGSYAKARRTYYISRRLHYPDWIPGDWALRTQDYASAVKMAISRIAKTRLSDAERSWLIDLAERATVETLASPPERIAPVEAREDIVQGYLPQADKLPVIPRLFRRDGEVLYFYEAFPRENEIVEYEGECGVGGDNRFHPFDTVAQARKLVAKLKTDARARGYRPQPASKQKRLIVEYPVVEGFADSGELDTRHALEEFLDDLLGQLGLGHCDGGSSGQGTMEVCCYVVGFKLAKAAIEPRLAESPFANYSRIYLEN